MMGRKITTFSISCTRLNYRALANRHMRYLVFMALWLYLLHDVTNLCRNTVKCNDRQPPNKCDTCYLATSYVNCEQM